MTFKLKYLPLLMLCFILKQDLDAQIVPPPATQAEVDAGANRFKYVTPFTFANSGLISGPTNGVTATTATNIAEVAASSKQHGSSTLTNLSGTRAITNGSATSFRISSDRIESIGVLPRMAGVEFYDSFEREGITNYPGVSDSGHIWQHAAIGNTTNLVYINEGEFKQTTNGVSGASYWGVTRTNLNVNWTWFGGTVKYRGTGANGFEDTSTIILSRYLDFNTSQPYLHFRLGRSWLQVQLSQTNTILNENFKIPLTNNVFYTFNCYVLNNRLVAEVGNEKFEVVNDSLAQESITNATALIYEHNRRTTNITSGWYVSYGDAWAGAMPFHMHRYMSDGIYRGTNGGINRITLATNDAYAAGWNGSLDVPTKNAVYDKIETLSGSSDGGEVFLYTNQSGHVTLNLATNWIANRLSTIGNGVSSLTIQTPIYGKSFKLNVNGNTLGATNNSYSRVQVITPTEVAKIWATPKFIDHQGYVVVPKNDQITIQGIVISDAAGTGTNMLLWVSSDLTNNVFSIAGSSPLIGYTGYEVVGVQSTNASYTQDFAFWSSLPQYNAFSYYITNTGASAISVTIYTNNVAATVYDSKRKAGTTTFSVPATSLGAFKLHMTGNGVILEDLGYNSIPWAQDQNGGGKSLTNVASVLVEGTGASILSIASYQGDRSALTRATNSPAATGTTNDFQLHQSTKLGDQLYVLANSAGQIILTNGPIALTVTDTNQASINVDFALPYDLYIVTTSRTNFDVAFSNTYAARLGRSITVEFATNLTTTSIQVTNKDAQTVRWNRGFTTNGAPSVVKTNINHLTLMFTTPTTNHPVVDAANY